METNIKFNYPSSEKVYLSGKLYPEIKVGMRKVSLTPTITVEDGERRVEPNDPVYVYDTSGPYSDPNVEIDLEKGLPKLRQSWIDGRKEGETQMYFAKQGVITQEMEYVAIRENMNCEELGIKTHITPAFVCKEIAEGRAVIPANRKHPESEPMIIGTNFLVKINTNIGNSATTSGMQEEVEKAVWSCKWGRRHIDGPLNGQRHTRNTRVDSAQLSGSGRHCAYVSGVREGERQGRRPHLGDFPRYID